MKKIKNNKTIEQKIFEYEFELDGLNKEKIKLETEIKNLEEKYNLLFEEKTKNEQEEEFYKNQINELEKIQQENLTLKADSIIYREDILHLSEINKKLKIIEKKK